MITPALAPPFALGATSAAAKHPKHPFVYEQQQNEAIREFLGLLNVILVTFMSSSSYGRGTGAFVTVHGQANQLSSGNM